MLPPIQQTFDDALRLVLTTPDRGIRYKRVPRKAATFQSGVDVPVHRWFRLTPSFGPDLVRQMLAELQADKTELILDPFAGASTTLIEAQLLGHTAVGFEINPLLHFVGETSLNWECSPTDIEAALRHVEDAFAIGGQGVTFHTLQAHGLRIPPIHNPTRWWRPDVLLELLVLKKAIQETNYPPKIRQLLMLGLANALVPDLTNVTLGRLQLHFIDRSSDQMDVLGTFVKKIREIIVDLKSLQDRRDSPRSRVFHQDCTDLANFKPRQPISIVVTSPPYPNRYSYVWNTRPHLYFLDYFTTPKQASDLDVKTIGGTWGTATSMLAKGVVHPSHPAVTKIVGPAAAQIRQHDNLMANYLLRYFDLLAKQVLAMAPHLAPNARLAYVVGCSRLKGVYIETDALLGSLFEALGLGLRLTKIERIRRRNSGKDLHESIVYAHRD